MENTEITKELDLLREELLKVKSELKESKQNCKELERKLSKQERQLNLNKEGMQLETIIYSLLEHGDLPIEKTFQRIVDFIPESSSFPKGAHLRIIYGGNTFQDPTFRPSREYNKLRMPFNVADIIDGQLELHIPKASPLDTLQRHTLTSIAETISKIYTYNYYKEQYLTLFEDNELGACIVEKRDGNYYIKSANKQHLINNDAKLEELINNPISSTSLPTQGAFDELIDMFDSGKYIHKHEIHYTTPEGINSYSTVSTKPIFGLGKSLFICTFNNHTEVITLREQKEEALQLSQRIIDSLPFIVALSTKEGELVYANKTLREAKKIESVEGLKITDVINPSCLAGGSFNSALGEFDPNQSSTKHSSFCELHKRHYDVCIQALRVNQRGLFLTTLLDITRYKEAQAEQRKVAKEFETILLNMNDGFMRCDADGNIDLVNEEIVRMFGYKSAEELIGQSIVKLYDDLEAFEKISQQIATLGEIRNAKVRACRKDGTSFWVSTTINYVFDKETNELLYTSGVVRDIDIEETEHRRILELSEQLSSVLNTMGDAFIETNIELKIIRANPASAKMFGYNSPDEMMGLHVEKLYYDANVLKQEMEELPLKDELIDQRSLGQRKDGSTFLKSVLIKLFRDSEGNPIKTRGIVRDIDDEVKYRKIAKLLECYTENSACAMLMLSPNDKILYSNPNLYKMIGYNNQEEFNKIYSRGQLISTAQKKNILKQLIKEGEIKDLILSIEHKSKKELWLSCDVKCKFNEEGRLTCINTVIRDITKTHSQKLVAEEAMKKIAEEHIRFKTIVENANDGIALIGTRTGAFIWTNPMFSEMTQYTLDELKKMKSLDVEIHGKKNDSLFETLKNEDEVKGYKTRLNTIRKDGTILTADVTVEDVFINKKRYLLAIYRDASEQVRREQVLVESKNKAEKSEKRKMEFLTNMAHEIRTPLNGILGFVDLLKDPSMQDSHLMFIDTIEQSGEKLLETINTLLDVARADNQKIETNLEQVDINEIINFHANFFAPQVAEKGLELKVQQLIKESQHIIVSDRKILDGILTNLIKNAIKFTEKGYVSIKSSIENNHLVLSVSDSGIGISKEKLPSVFDRFAQAENAQSNKTKGTGLGLPIVASYTKALLGEVSVESKVKQGSIFTVKLPLQTLTCKIDADRPREKKTILLIEPYSINQKYLSHILHGEYEIKHVSTGEDAILELKDAQYDLVLLNPNLSGKLDAISTIKIIKETYNNIPILLQSTSTNTQEEKKIFDAGCNKQILIPFTKHQLTKALQELLESAE